MKFGVLNILRSETKDAADKAYEANKVRETTNTWELAQIAQKTRFEDVGISAAQKVAANDFSISTAVDCIKRTKHLPVKLILLEAIAAAKYESTAIHAASRERNPRAAEFLFETFFIGKKYEHALSLAKETRSKSLKQDIFQQLQSTGDLDVLKMLCIRSPEVPAESAFGTLPSLWCYPRESTERKKLAEAYCAIASESPHKGVVAAALGKLIEAGEDECVKKACASTKFEDIGKRKLAEFNAKLQKAIDDAGDRAFRSAGNPHDMNTLEADRLAKERQETERRAAGHGGDHESAGCHLGDGLGE